MFIESIRIIYTISLASWYADRKVVIEGVKFQVDIDSAQNKTSPEFLIASHQSLARKNVPKKKKDGRTYPKLSVNKLC